MTVVIEEMVGSSQTITTNSYFISSGCWVYNSAVFRPRCFVDITVLRARTRPNLSTMMSALLNTSPSIVVTLPSQSFTFSVSQEPLTSDKLTRTEAPSPVVGSNKIYLHLHRQLCKPLNTYTTSIANLDIVTDLNGSTSTRKTSRNCYGKDTTSKNHVTELYAKS